MSESKSEAAAPTPSPSRLHGASSSSSSSSSSASTVPKYAHATHRYGSLIHPLPIATLKHSAESIISELAGDDASKEAMLVGSVHESQQKLFRDLNPKTTEHGEVIEVATLKSRLEETGIPLTDRRIEGVSERCGSRTHLDFSQFRAVIDPCVLITEKALNGKLAIPEWAKFVEDLKELYKEAEKNVDGEVASYIPELANTDAKHWGLSFCSIDGQQFNEGPSTMHPFSVQSAGKPLTYLMAMELHGEEHVHRFVGREPSGRAFNEMALNHEGIPHNPMINSGAIMTCALVHHTQPDSFRFNFIMDFWRKLAPDHPPHFNNTIYLSEKGSANRNFSLGYMMQEKGAFQYGREKKKPPRPWGSEDMCRALDLYFMCCSIEVTCRGMATTAATLANGGVNPITGERVFRAENVRNALSLMLSCGLYDYSGEWAYQIGLPAKSGVSGVVMVVIPNVGGLALFSPRLDSLGNSARSIEFCKLFGKKFPWHYLTASASGPKKRGISSTATSGGISSSSSSSSSAATAAAAAPSSSSSSSSSSTSTPAPAPSVTASTGSAAVDVDLPPNPARQIDHKYSDMVVALCSACAAGDLGALKGLVASGANLNESDYDLRTALHLAAAEGHLALVKYLIAKRVYVNVEDRFLHTPLSEAKRGGHTAVCDFLRANGALDVLPKETVEGSGTPVRALSASTSLSSLLMSSLPAGSAGGSPLTSPTATATATASGSATATAPAASTPRTT